MTKIEAKKNQKCQRRKKRFLARSVADGPANTKHKEVSLFLVCEVPPDYEVGRLFLNVYQHLANPDDEADRFHSM